MVWVTGLELFSGELLGRALVRNGRSGTSIDEPGESNVYEQKLRENVHWTYRAS